MMTSRSEPDRSVTDQLAARAREPLDADDLDLLAMLARVSESVDPMPAGLVDRVQFALALDEVFDEVATLQRADALAGARGGADASTQRCSRITFTSESVTVMVTLTAVDAGLLRLDGWLAATDGSDFAPWLVRLRAADRERTEPVDADGRFSLDRVPRGFGQLVFVPAASPGSAGGGSAGSRDNGPGGPARHAVVTPTFEL